MRTKKRIRLKGRLRIYMQTSLYMGILLLIVDIGTYFLDVRAGFLLTCFLLFYFGMIILLMFYNRPIILNELISFATQYGQVQKTLLRDMAIPYALLDETGRVIWCNDAFRAESTAKRAFISRLPMYFRQSRGSVCRRASRRRKSRSPLKRAIISRILRGYRCGG